MADYPVIRLQYRLRDRWKDRRNAVKDRRKDIINYRKNRNTRYLSYLKSEQAFQTKKEQSRCHQYCGNLQERERDLANTLAQAKEMQQRISSQLQARRKECDAEADFVAKAAGERVVGRLASQLAQQNNAVRQLERDIQQLDEAAKTAADISEKNIQALQSLYGMRMNNYVNVLFKKEKRKKQEGKK